MLISVHKARRRAHRGRTMGSVVSAATGGVDTDAKENEPLPGSSLNAELARLNITLSEQTGKLLRKQQEFEASYKRRLSQIEDLTRERARNSERASELQGSIDGLRRHQEEMHSLIRSIGEDNDSIDELEANIRRITADAGQKEGQYAAQIKKLGTMLGRERGKREAHVRSAHEAKKRALDTQLAVTKLKLDNARRKHTRQQKRAEALQRVTLLQSMISANEKKDAKRANKALIGEKQALEAELSKITEARHIEEETRVMSERADKEKDALIAILDVKLNEETRRGEMYTEEKRAVFAKLAEITTTIADLEPMVTKVREDTKTLLARGSRHATESKDYKAKVTELEQQLSQLDAQKRDTTKAIQRLDAQNTENRSKINDLTAQIETAALAKSQAGELSGKEKLELQNIHADLRSQITSLDTEMRSNVDKMAKQDARIKELHAEHERKMGAITNDAASHSDKLASATSKHTLDIEAANARYTEIENRVTALTDESLALTAEHTKSAEINETLTAKLRAAESASAESRDREVATTSKLEASQAALTEIARELATLKEEARQARELEAGYATEKATLVAKQDELSRSIDTSAMKIQELRQEHSKQTSGRDGKIASLGMRNEQLSVEVTSLDTSLKEEAEKRSDLYAKNTRYLDLLTTRGAASFKHKARIRTLEHDIEQTTGEIERMKSAHSALDERMRVTDLMIADGSARSKALEESVTHLTSELSQKERETAELKVKSSEAAAALETATDKNRSLDEQMRNLSSQAKSARAQEAKMKRKLEEQLAATALCEGNAAIVQTELANAKKNAADSIATVTRLVAQTSSTKEEATRVSAALDAAKAKNDNLDRQIAELSSKLVITQTEIDTHKTNEANTQEHTRKAKEANEAYASQIGLLKAQSAELAVQLLQANEEKESLRNSKVERAKRTERTNRPTTPERFLTQDGTLDVARAMGSMQTGDVKPTELGSVLKGIPDTELRTIIDSGTYTDEIKERALWESDDRRIMQLVASSRERGSDLKVALDQHDELKAEQHEQNKEKKAKILAAARTEKSERIIELDGQLTALATEKSGLVSTIAKLSAERNLFRSLCAHDGQSTDECLQDLMQMKSVFTDRTLKPTSTDRERRGTRTSEPSSRKSSLHDILRMHIDEKVSVATSKLHSATKTMAADAATAQERQKKAQETLETVRKLNTTLEEKIKECDKVVLEKTQENTLLAKSAASTEKANTAKVLELETLNSEIKRKLTESTERVSQAKILRDTKEADIALLQAQLRRKETDAQLLAENAGSMESIIRGLTENSLISKIEITTLQAKIEETETLRNGLLSDLTASTQELDALKKTHDELTSENNELVEVAKMLQAHIEDRNLSDPDLQVIIDNYTNRFVAFHSMQIDDALQKAEAALVYEQVAAEHKIKSELRKEQTRAISTATDQLEADYVQRLTNLSGLYLKKVKDAHDALTAIGKKALRSDQQTSLATQLAGHLGKEVNGEFNVTVTKPKTKARSSTPTTGADLIEAPVGALKLADTLEELKRRSTDMRWVRGVTSLIDIKNYVDRFPFSAKDQIVLRGCAEYIEEPDQALRKGIISGILRSIQPTQDQGTEPIQDAGAPSATGEMTLVSYIAGLVPNDEEGLKLTEENVRRLLRIEATDKAHPNWFGRFI